MSRGRWSSFRVFDPALTLLRRCGFEKPLPYTTLRLLELILYFPGFIIEVSLRSNEQSIKISRKRRQALRFRAFYMLYARLYFID